LRALKKDVKGEEDLTVDEINRKVRPSARFCGLPWIDVLPVRLRRVWVGRGGWVGRGHSEGDRLVVVPI